MAREWERWGTKADILVRPLSEARKNSAWDGGRKRQGNHPVTDKRSERTQDDPNYEHICGYAAEEDFEDMTGLPMDRSLQRKGDGLVDFQGMHFWLPMRGTLPIDVKARAQLPWYPMLIKEEALHISHVYVDAWINWEENEIIWRGWIFGAEARRFPKRPARGWGLRHGDNFEIGKASGSDIVRFDVTLMHPMSELLTGLMSRD